MYLPNPFFPPRFKELYKGVISQHRDILTWDSDKSLYRQDTTPSTTLSTFKQLPEHLSGPLMAASDTEDLKNIVSNRPTCSSRLRQQLEVITRRSSWSQSLKGFFTAGLSKSLLYAGRKLLKHYRSR